MKVLVCGSRDFASPEVIGWRMAALPGRCMVIHGAARGADQIAAKAAHDNGHTVVPVSANWKRDGKLAGIARNIVMLDMRPELVIAFWDGKSRGTAHTIEQARKRGIPVEVIPPESVLPAR